MLSLGAGAGLLQHAAAHSSHPIPVQCSSGVLAPPLLPALHTLAHSHATHQPTSVPTAASHQHHTQLQPQLLPQLSRRRQRRREALQLQPHLHSASPFLVQASQSDSYSAPDDDGDPDDEVPTKFELMQRASSLKPTVRVRLSVHYRVHSRQVLCIGGSLIPFGWSFLSIAKVPMTWNSGDVWTCEVDLQAGQRIEYKYVILEEQDWTRLVNEEAQGLVEIKYRTGREPAQPPNVQAIQRQMAIVAWQPGPNRILNVPSEEELQELQVGEAIERIPPLPTQPIPYQNTVKREPVQKTEPFEGTWEVLTTDKEGKAFLDRYDAWGWTNRRPPALRGLSFG